MPHLNDPSVSPEPILDFTSGYVQRSVADLPKQGSKEPWKLRQNYAVDLRKLRYGSLEDGAMQFKRRVPAPERVVVLALLVAVAFLVFAAPAAAHPWIGVQGATWSTRPDAPCACSASIAPGTEYSCQQGYGFFDGPSDAASIAAMKSWHINAVRVPLNETCWLGINGIDPKLGGAAYRRTIRAWVTRLEDAGLYVILDLHWAAPGSQQATGIIPMPDADHAPDFWRSVAAEYKDDHAVLFDLYNEPHEVGWGCWENGCTIHDPRVGTYRAAGMAELVEAVRSTGATQPVMLGGTEWARNDGGWLAHLPPDPADAEVASNHTYNFAACFGSCRAALAKIAKHPPGGDRRAGGGRLPRHLHRPIYGLGRRPRDLLPRLGLGHPRRLDLPGRPVPDHRLRRHPDRLRPRLPRTPAAARGERLTASRRRPDNLGAMDDQQVLDRIDKLVKEEEDLLHRHEGEGLGDDEHARLEEIKIQLDKTWDYLRQRRSLREAGDDPDEASERDGGTVEDYGTVTPYDDTDGDAPE